MATAGQAQQSDGVYLCTTVERAAIAGTHLEDAGAPKAKVNKNTPTTFKMQISRIGQTTKKFTMTELPYQGSDSDRAVWQDDNAVLHSVYTGDGSVFHALNGPAFLTLGSTQSDGTREFYHAGFELPGGEDTQIAVRWGRCRKEE